MLAIVLAKPFCLFVFNPVIGLVEPSLSQINFIYGICDVLCAFVC